MWNRVKNNYLDIKKIFIEDRIDESIRISKEAGNIRIVNLSPEIKIFKILTKPLAVFFEGSKFLNFNNKVIVIKGEANFILNNKTIFLNSEYEQQLKKLEIFKLELQIKPNTELIIQDLDCRISDKSLFADKTSDADILVISPGYPRTDNLYNFGFVHSATKTLLDKGLKIEVFCVDNTRMINYFDNVQITYADYSFLKEYIFKSKFKKIVIHFITYELEPIIETVILYQGIKIYVYVHGAESLYRRQELMCMGYDGKYHPYRSVYEIYKQELMFKKYASNLNFTWIFVSNWMKQITEEYNDAKFINYQIIPNLIDDKIFSYVPKIADDRLNILTLRRFDNFNKYALDLVIESILVLSKKKFFKELNFCLCGDGELFERFSKRINFPNVKFIRGFFNHQQLTELHKECGIILHPTRLDSMGVSSLEAVSSGLVLISSNNTAIPEFINPIYGTLSNDTENPISYAEIIENLYHNPNRFLELSKIMSEEIRAKYGKKAFIEKTISLFSTNEDFYIEPDTAVFSQNLKKLLTICIPAYNIASYLKTCLNSILSCKNKHFLEIIVVNDGSSDNTSDIADEYANKFPKIVRLINQSNKGHGGAVNTGMRHATAKYFRIVDGDDHIDPIELDKMIKYLGMLDVDLVITDMQYNRASEYRLSSGGYNYPKLPKREIISFEKANFNPVGHVLATANYKTELLSSVNLLENCFYADMEYNVKAIANVQTVCYLDFVIYKYFVGRSEQSILKFRKKDHEKVLTNILKFINRADIGEYKKRYCLKFFFFPMLETHYIICRRDKHQDYFKSDIKFFAELGKLNKKLKYNEEELKIKEEIDKKLSKYNSLKFKLSQLFALSKKTLKIPLAKIYRSMKFIYTLLNAYEIYYFNKYARYFLKIKNMVLKIIH